MRAPRIRVEEVRVVGAQSTVLDIPALHVTEGEVLGLIGPNGAGKSTLLRVLALLQPGAATYELDGQPVDPRRDGLRLRRQMGVVFQDPLLLNASVAANVAVGLRLRRIPRRELVARVEEWLQRLGIAHLAQRRAHTLSGGEAQRAALARALVLRPRILFMDEPFAELDALTRQPLILELRQLIRETGVTVAFATHDFLEIMLLADRVAVLERGRVVQEGAPREVYLKPSTDTVKGLLSGARELVDAVGRPGD